MPLHLHQTMQKQRLFYGLKKTSHLYAKTSGFLQLSCRNSHLPLWSKESKIYRYLRAYEIIINFSRLGHYCPAIKLNKKR